MFGTNRAEPWLRDSDGKMLDVQEVFRTVQGEGPYAGLDAVFVRLAGCHLRCWFCDTDFTSKRHPVEVNQLVDRVLGAFGGPRPPMERADRHWLVVLTGGEPMRQNIVPLCFHLTSHPGVVVQVETAGTYWVPEGYAEVWEDMLAAGKVDLVVSPKTPRVHEAVARNACAWKYVVGAETEVEADGRPRSDTQDPGRAFPLRLAPPPPHLRAEQVYVQPRDDGNPVHNAGNVNRCVALAQQYGYRLSLQQHKVVGLP